jgi:multiple antibiotic resistance protein
LLLGGYVLNFFGVSLGALRVGGGLVVAVQAWSLLMAPDANTTQRADQTAPAVGERPDIAFFPLTMPLTTGPGSISVAIALASQRPAHSDSLVQFFAGLSLAALANVLFVWVCYTYADQVMKITGEGGARIVSRLAAFLLLCIGVQIISTGVESLIGPWLLKTARMA